MLQELAVRPDRELSTTVNPIGQAANDAAQASVFADYRIRKAANTIRRQDAGLALFADYLLTTGMMVGDLATDASAWAKVTWGLVAGFVDWQLSAGYAIGTINVRLSDVKVYAGLALQSGTLTVEEFAMISLRKCYKYAEIENLDNARESAGIKTRIGTKKTEPTSITRSQADELKDQPDTAQGRRDRLIMCILLDHGLRVSEVALLQIENFNLETGEFKFRRPKTDKVKGELHTHELSGDTWRAAKAYITIDLNREIGPLLVGSVKGGELTGAMSIRAINKRVGQLGKAKGIEGLSPHDLRHYSATRLAKEMSMRELMSIFGWSSPAMAIRYIEAAEVVKVE